MPKKNSPKYVKHLFLKIIIYAITFIVSVFFFYEISTIGNPFMDPFPPYIIWGGMFVIIISLVYRIVQVSKS